MLIDEWLDESGARHVTELGLVEPAVDGAELELRHGATQARLPWMALAVVMRRYGRPLEHPTNSSHGETLAADAPEPALHHAGARLGRLRFRAAVDAIGRDYLVWEEDSAEPVACLAVTVAAALRHLARL